MHKPHKLPKYVEVTKCVLRFFI